MPTTKLKPKKVSLTPVQKLARKAVLDNIAVVLDTLDQQASVLNTAPAIVSEADRVASDYDACLDSVNLILGGKPVDMGDADWARVVLINKQHLGHKLISTQWTDEDLSPFITAFNT